MAEESSASALVSGILNDLRELVREEIALARAEVREEIGKAKDAAVSGVAGAAALAVGGLFLLTFVALGIAAVFTWPAWSGFLIVGGLLAIAGAMLLMRARTRLQRVNPALPKTAASVKENVEWVEARTSRRTT